MKSYLDEKEKDTESEYSVHSGGDQAIPDLGEVILETDGELHDSQKLDETLEVGDENMPLS